ncbi:MAG TPA: biopolymer transporter ExbD [Zeimonas sp.]
MSEGEFGEINVVPLVDVMLVLLAIVLTTASFVATGRIPVALANAASAAPIRSAPLVLTLTHDERLYLDDEPVGDLAASLAARGRDAAVVVRADGRLALSKFVELVDRVRTLGFEQVSLEVRRP